MPTLTQIVTKCLRLPSDALVWEASRLIAEHFPSHYVLETGDYDFQLAEYARSGRCSLHPIDDNCAQFHAVWMGKEQGAVLDVQNAILEVLWRGKRLHVLTLTYTIRCEVQRHWIIADRMEDAKEFFSAVCGYSAVAEGNILVFQDGTWHKDKRLLETVSKASFDDLVLPEATLTQVKKEVESFFTSKEIYAQMGVSWKRGLLLTGPPGNGKTHLIKALIQHTGKPCLYVRSFKSEYEPSQVNVERVFQRARQAAPCILVLEDIDSLLSSSFLSAFLNAMDGFAENGGILTIATTNHPEKIDVALLDRPSRFDRKIEFGLPEVAERGRYVKLLDTKRSPEMQIADEEISEIAKATAGYSFALLKELHVASTMAWMEDRIPGSMARVTLTTAKRIYRAPAKTKKEKAKKK